MKTKLQLIRRLFDVTLLTVSILVLDVSRAEGRLEESIAQCEARYGKPFRIQEDGLHVYRKQPMLVACKYDKGICVSIAFCHSELDVLNNPSEMSDAEIQAILEANSGGRTWVKKQVFSSTRQWDSSDGYLCAGYTAENYLLITAKAEADRSKAEAAQNEKGRLKDF